MQEGLHGPEHVEDAGRRDQVDRADIRERRVEGFRPRPVEDRATAAPPRSRGCAHGHAPAPEQFDEPAPRVSGAARDENRVARHAEASVRGLFAKGERDNIDAAETRALLLLARSLMELPDAELDRQAGLGNFREVTPHGEADGA